MLVQPAADDVFSEIEGLGLGGDGINFSGVKKIDAPVDGVVQNRVRIGLIDLLAKGHGAQANGGDVELRSAELNCFHGGVW